MSLLLAACSKRDIVAADAELEHRVVAQAIGIIAVFIAAADLIDPLCQQVVLGMGDVACVPGVDQRCIDALGQADLGINPTKQQRPKVGRQPPRSKSARTVWPGMDAKRRCSEVEFMPGKVLFVLMTVFLDNSHLINHLRHSCLFLCKIQARPSHAC